MHILTELSAYLPAGLDFTSVLMFILIFAGAVLVVGLIFRFVFGKLSGLNQAISTAMGILCIYVLTTVIYTFNPYDLSKFLAPLPFVTFTRDNLFVFSLLSADFPTICDEVLSMIILAFLVNLLDTILPKGKNFLTWFLYRFVTVVLAMVLHYLVTWMFNAFMPGVLVTYAPMILLGTLVIMLSLGLLRFLLGLIVTVANPLLGAFCSFFFFHKIGKQLSKAVLTTTVLCILVYCLNYFGCLSFGISAVALQAYIPALIIFLALWYVVGHLL